MLGAGELAAFLVGEGRDSWPADSLRTDKSAAPYRCDEMSGRAGECGGRGHPDLDRLERCVGGGPDRGHGARSHFGGVGGLPVRVIAMPRGLSPTLIALSALPVAVSIGVTVSEPWLAI
jgi:hypothetical protein